ncbi:ATP-binding protein [Nonomuraea angiospora]|uniref:hypothetical protein n=1 Tax=Nonomuraea angiospora TaxID=46172 RepID=UPI0029A7D913|nr:hypothetical protein [Nonomuraea angiospora]MDX3102144.1 hypothetical protein [Nonomuraea angiospora]
MGVAQRTGVILPSCPDLKLALVLGERALFVNGDLQTARRWFDSAYRLAELCGDPSSLARAALGLGGIWVHEHRTCAESEMVRARQRHALSLVDPRSSTALRLRVRLRGEEDYRAGRHATIMELLAEVRGSGDGQALAEALSLAHHCLLGPGHAAIRLELASELIGQAAVTERGGDLLMGLLWRTVDLYLAAELLPVLSDLVSSPTLSPIDNSYLAGLALAAAVAGDRRAAAGHLARLRVEEVPASSTWLVSMYCVVETAHLLQDPDTAARAYALLRPFADLPVVASLGVACFGSAHHSLGMAALTTGDLPTAVEHLRAAVRGNLALGHWPAAALSRWRLGQALALRDGARDQAAAREQAAAAREARELGMVLPAVVGRSSAGQDGCRLRRHGRHWQVELGGRLALVDHSVGMGHLATLVANPGREILAADLAAGAWPREPEGGSVQPLLDEQARDTYRQRLGRLEAEIDELESMNDLERAAGLRLEREWLVAELAAATGIGGRARPFTGSEERARIAVGKAIRRALARISAVDPAIGEELRATVQTGLRCCYRPR